MIGKNTPEIQNNSSVLSALQTLEQYKEKGE